MRKATRSKKLLLLSLIPTLALGALEVASKVSVATDLAGLSPRVEGRHVDAVPA